MARQRYVDTKFWSDEWVSHLDPVEKLLFLYLLTNERTSICGIYELPLKYMAVESGIDREMVEKILKRFEKQGRVCYKNGWVALKNFIKHQDVRNPKIQAGIAYELDRVPKAMVSLVEIPEVVPVRKNKRTRVSRSKREAVIRMHGNQCSNCQSTDNLEIDHIKPVVMGGTSDIANLRPLCQSCNGRRNAALQWSKNGWTMGRQSYSNVNSNTNPNGGGSVLEECKECGKPTDSLVDSAKGRVCMKCRGKA